MLLDCLRSPHADIRAKAAGHLLQVQPTNALAFTYITNALADPRAGDVPHAWFLAQLAQLGPAASAALPVVRGLQAHPSAGVQKAAAAALRAIEGGR